PRLRRATAAGAGGAGAGGAGERGEGAAARGAIPDRRERHGVLVDERSRQMTRPRFLLALALAALLGGPAGAAAVEIEVATWHWTEPARGAVLRKMVEQFVREHPGITIKEVSVPFPRYVEQMLLRL